MISTSLARRILSEVDQEGIVQMSEAVISIPSPTGEELEMARYMSSIFRAMGLFVSWQEIEEGRANVVGLLEGRGNGKSLMFNGHMDTSYSGREAHLTGIGFKTTPVVKDGVIYGLGIYNMKGALVCYTHALKAVQAAGVRLKGDVLIAAVAGEIEKSQWGDQYRGRQYRGYGVGTHHLVNRGVIPDMCILGEPTDMKLVLGHYGSMWVRFSTRGAYMHTGFSVGRQGENSIHRMRQVLNTIVEWMPSWEEKSAYRGKRGVVNLGCLRGGHPWRASRLPERCDAFFDVRVPPTMPMAEARREVRQLALTLREKFPDYGIEEEIYVSAPGAEIDEDHEVVQALDASHRDVLGQPPARDTVIWCSDASVMTRYGIPTINYGPSSGVRKSDGEKVAVRTLVDITRVYALTIARICEATG
ncbi:MAG: M20 family metallopeptidase [Acidobacteriota bacterium]